MEQLENILSRMRKKIEQKEKPTSTTGIKCSEVNLEDVCISLGLPYVEKEAETYRAELVDAFEKKKQCVSCMKIGEECVECFEEETIYDNGYEFRFKTCSKGKAHLKQKRIERLMGQSRLSERFKRRRFDTFIVSPKTKNAFDECMRFCNEYSIKSRKRGVLMIGNYGCGKTHLAAAILNTMINSGVSGMFVVVPELLNKMRDSFDDESSTREIEEQAKTVDVLVLDDLGAEKPSDWVREQLYILINYRYENELPTIVTTNCNGSELRDKLGARILSRIVEMTVPIVIDAPDYRMKGAV